MGTTLSKRKYRKCPSCGHKWPLVEKYFLRNDRSGRLRLKCWRCSPDPITVGISLVDRASNTAFIWNTKSKYCCVTCGEIRPEVLCFHHRDSKSKSFALSQALHKTRGEIEAEISKCDIMCCNCHASLHYWVRQKC